MSKPTEEFALMVQNLNKDFPTFSLKDVSFQVPVGSVVGLVGENGSGKTTCVRCILGQDVPTSGTITILGQSSLDSISSHKAIGVAFESCPFPDVFTPKQIAKVMEKIYPTWNSKIFLDQIQHLEIPQEQPIRTFSRGMKAKVSLSAALAHQAKLLVLDEATSGLDPIVREEILDTLLAYMEQQACSILMTSHISSDLERIADFIVFLQEGQVIFVKSKEELESYGLARVRQDQLEFIDPTYILKMRPQALWTDILVCDRNSFRQRYPDYALDQATLDEVILMYGKGENL